MKTFYIWSRKSALNYNYFEYALEYLFVPLWRQVGEISNFKSTPCNSTLENCCDEISEIKYFKVYRLVWKNKSFRSFLRTQDANSNQLLVTLLKVIRFSARCTAVMFSLVSSCLGCLFSPCHSAFITTTPRFLLLAQVQAKHQTGGKSYFSVRECAMIKKNRLSLRFRSNYHNLSRTEVNTSRVSLTSCDASMIFTLSSLGRRTSLSELPLRCGNWK